MHQQSVLETPKNPQLQLQAHQQDQVLVLVLVPVLRPALAVLPPQAFHQDQSLSLVPCRALLPDHPPSQDLDQTLDLDLDLVPCPPLGLLLLLQPLNQDQALVLCPLLVILLAPCLPLLPHRPWDQDQVQCLAWEHQLLCPLPGCQTPCQGQGQALFLPPLLKHLLLLHHPAFHLTLVCLP